MRRTVAAVLIATPLLWAAVGVVVLSSCWAQQEQSQRKIVDRAVPAYPELARKLNITGIVKVRALVQPGGRVKTLEAVGGNPVLAKAAVDAVQKWRWEPASQESTENVELIFHPK